MFGKIWKKLRKAEERWKKIGKDEKKAGAGHDGKAAKRSWKKIGKAEESWWKMRKAEKDRKS
jgi:hypothetical protein